MPASTRSSASSVPVAGRYPRGKGITMSVGGLPSRRGTPWTCSPGQTVKIDLNLVCAMPEDECGVFKMRSSLADKYGMLILGGLIDSDYADGWQLLLHMPAQDLDGGDERVRCDRSAGADCVRFKQGERIAQVKFEKVPVHHPRTGTREEVEQIIRDRKSDRTGGFGSTGA